MKDIDTNHDDPLFQQKVNANSKNSSDAKMKKAYELASSLIRDRLEAEDKENIEIMDEIASDDVIVIEGQYDHIHLVLEHSKIPFTRIQPSQLENLELRSDQTVFVNCTGRSEEHTSELQSH